MKNSIIFLIYFLLVVFIISCTDHGNNPEQSDNNIFSVNEDFILKDGIPFLIKGVVYVPGYPGYVPWEIEYATDLPSELEKRIESDLADIKSINANTVRFWGAPQYCYEVAQDLDLAFIQTIWFDGEAYDFQDDNFKENCKSYVRDIIDRIYSVFKGNPPIICYLAGNELSRAGIIRTNNLHPDILSFSGNFIKTDSSINASEAFIAEMADYIKSYEYNKYGYSHLVSYANDIRTFDMIDTPFLDFRSHNAYSYAVDYYLTDPPAGSTSGTIFQGWIEFLKNQQINKPLLITETGLSVSPEAPHTGPPNYGYGGNTEEEQSTGLIQNIEDIASASEPLAGVIIHEYLDAWWKFGLEDSYTHESDDVEEWFGICKLIEMNDFDVTQPRPVFYNLADIWKY